MKIIGSPTLHEDTSPNNKNIIIFKDKGSFLFGDSNLLIIAKKKREISPLKTLKYETSISNDGKSLSSNNLSISWVDEDTAIVTLIGETDLNEKIKFTFDADISYEVLQP
ncbi:MAG: hypothetical protein ACRDBA_14315 [Clostridium sp.]